MAALLAFAGTPNILPIHRSQGDPVSVSKTDKIHPLTISPQFQQQQRDLLLNALARGGFIELESPVEELPGRIYVKDPPRRTGLHIEHHPSQQTRNFAMGDRYETNYPRCLVASCPLPFNLEFDMLGSHDEFLQSDIYPSLESPTTALDAFPPSPTHSIELPTSMAKKRRSLQSILIPSFLNSPPSSLPTSPTSSYASRARSHSSGSELIYHPPLDGDPLARPSSSRASSSPPPFPLDEDPFARLESASTAASPLVQPSSSTPSRPTVSAPSTPRSPLSPSATSPASRLSPPFRSSPATVTSFQSPRAHPAHSRPAFTPRPSLPSLHTLAQMNIYLPRKIRKGKVGARLPYEPWDDQTPPTFDQNGALPGPSTHNAPPPTTPDFTSDLDTDFLDFSDDHDNDDDDQDDDDYFDDSTIEVGPPSGFSASELFNTDNIEPPTSLSRSPSATDASLTLSRSISVSSSSSLSDADEYDRPLISADSSRRSNDSQHSTSSQPHSSSAESDSDIPRSPPDDGYFCFPRSTSPGNESNDGDYEHHQDGIDMPFHPLDRTPHHSLYFHRSNSLGMGNAESSFEAGSSAGTVRGSSLHAWAMSRSRRHSTKWIGNETSSETVDGSDWRTGSNGNYSSQYSGGSGGNSGYGRTSGGRGEGGGGYNGYNGGGRGNGGSGGDDGDDRRGRRGREAYGHQPAFPSDTEDDESGSDDDYGVPSASNSKTDIPAEYSASDDDVPLAQRIPTALTAQKSIRLKVRAERDQRRKERAAKAAAQTQQPRMPMSAMNPPFQTMPPMTAEPTTRTGRQRTMTMPSNTARPFAAEELTRRLAATQIPDMPTRSKSRSRRPSDDYDTRQPVPEMPLPSRSAKARSRPASPDRAPRSVPDLPTRSARSRSRPPSPDRSVPNGQFDAGRTLRPMRSFHRPNARPVVDHSIPLPSPNDFKQGLARSKTDARARRRDELPIDHGNKSKSLNMQGTDATDFDQMMRGRKQDGGHLTVQRRDQSRSGRPSLDRDAYPPPRKSLQRQTPSPVPPLPLPDVKPQVVSQQRVFIGDMQSFNTVEISTATTALDVLEMVQAQGSLKHFHGSGGWMLFEVAQDFGMERPVRSFELLSDVQSSWNKDKMVNTFVIKMTPFSSILSRSNIPSSSPMHSGWLEYEVKRGKWSKRWVHLREHSLWMSKRDSGKDEVFICSLSNFDAYCVTRVHKAPKPYVFAVKSTDSLSFFENASDYLHIFSCSQQDGEKWMEVILLARSYVLYQEKNVLYNPKVVPSLPVSSGLNRSGTRKVSSGRPSQPLVEVPSPDVFAHGSLLQRK